MISTASRRRRVRAVASAVTACLFLYSALALVEQRGTFADPPATAQAADNDAANDPSGPTEPAAPGPLQQSLVEPEPVAPEPVAPEQAAATAPAADVESPAAAKAPTDAAKAPTDAAKAPTDAAKTPADAAESDVAKSRWALLPKRMPDGRRFSPIALYQSQMAELIPPNFRPIAIDRLNQAVTDLQAQGSDDRSSRLRSSLYVVQLVDDTLVSRRSVLDIESPRDSVSRLLLGGVNLAINLPQKPSAASALNIVPRIETDDQGELVAVVKGNSAIQFGWTLRGESSGASRKFKLKIPPSPQTRIVLAAPGDVVIEALHGVLRDAPSPPPEIDNRSPRGDIRYYIIDAGGLQELELRTRPKAQMSEAGALVVRGTSTRYEVDARGMNWTTRMIVQTPLGSRLPPLDVSHGTVIAVDVDLVSTEFTTTLMDHRARRIRIDAPIKSFQNSPPDASIESAPESSADSSTTTITVSGQLLWDGESGWCDLPTMLWRGNRVIYAEATSQTQLVVGDALEVVSWQLPDSWRTVSEESLGDTARMITAQGPPIAEWANLPAGTRTDRDSVAPWSRVRLKHQAAFQSSRAALQLDVGEEVLDARIRLQLNMDPAAVEPVRLQVQPGWTPLSLSLPASGRVIEKPNVDAKSNTLTLWPEPDDAPGAVLVIEATGVARLSSSGGVVAVPRTWFLRPKDVRTDLVAAVVPPPGLNWSGETALVVDRVQPAQLEPAELTFFRGVSDETLMFKPQTGRTPLVSLQPPGITFGVTTTLHLRREGQDVVESLVIETDSTNQLLKRLSIRTGPALGRPNLTWILRTAADRAPISLPPSDVQLDNEDTDGQYKVNLSERSMRDRRLVGRRRYPISGSLQIRLPTVPGATTQNSEVVLGPGLRLLQSSPSVLRVPDEVSTLSPAVVPSAGDRAAVTIDGGPGLAADAIGTRDVRLRYDAVDQPLITIEKSDVNANLTMVWQEDVRIVASSRGTDRVEATFQVSAAEPIQIDYEPDLQLAAIYRDNRAIDLLTVQQRPIVLQPASKRETILVVWNRNQIGSYWFRHCRIPRLTVSGVVLSSDYRLVAADDTFAPAALWRGSLGESQRESQRSSSLSMPAGEYTTLIRRNTALAVGWLLAAIIFAISWQVSRRSPLVVAVFVAAAVTAALLWWPWHIAIVGWVIVPAVAASLLATSLAWQASASQAEPRSGVSSAVDSNRSLPADSDDSSGFSLARPLSLLALVTWAVGSAVVAQDAAPTSSPAIIVLVPVDHAGQPMGDKVYIPAAVHSELFRVESSDLPEAARFLLADYRVTLQATRDDSGQNKTLVEAEYLVHVDRPTNRVRLPLSPTSVRRVELIQSDQDRIVKSEPDSDDSVIVTLPRGDAFRLRLTLIPTLTGPPKNTMLQLAIPKIASSRLTVETGRAINAVRMIGVAGMVTEEPDLGRWFADIGPINELNIAYQSSDQSADVVAQPLVRRYWVHVAKTGTTIDCEVEPMTSVRRGETVQLVIRDALMPTVVSSYWRLQRTELLSPSRRLITLQNLSDRSTPIRLMWSTPAPASRPSPGEETSMIIPEVIAPASGPNSAAWIAIDRDPTLGVRPNATDPLESLAVEQFLAAWKGYRGQIDRAFVAINELPSLNVSRLDQSAPAVRQQHDVHVMPDELQLRFGATLTQSDDAVATRRTLRYPVGVDVRRLLVNGENVDNQPAVTGDFQEIALPGVDSGEPIQIDVVAVASLGASGRFSLPHFELLPRAATTDQFSLSRDQTCNVEIKRVPIEPQQLPPIASAQSLAEGGIPVATWVLDSATGTAAAELSGGLFKVTKRQVSFGARQLIVLSREQGRWNMNTLIRFIGKQIPDFIDVQIPTRWCESLEVMPATTWSRQPAIDPSLQIVRIRCDAAALRDNPLTIRGQLAATDKGRVSVPPVAVLGRGSRKILISVPNRLTNESIQWRFSSVRGIEPPTIWENDFDVDESRSTYTVGSPAWSIELAPLAQVEFVSRAVSLDAQVLSRDESALVLCRWDLVPGGLNSVLVRVPPGAVCLGAWTAERAVEIETEVDSHGDASEGEPNEADPGPAASNLIRLPLSLSRLAQPVELLLRVPVAAARQADYLPELVDIDVVQEWVAVYEPSDTATAQSLSKQVENEGITVRHPVPLQTERAFALARSLADAVDHSLDTSVERPASEIAAWLAPWVARYRQIAESAGHHVNWDLSPVDETTDLGAGVPSLVSGGTFKLTEQPWYALDARMGEHVRRFLPAAPESATPLFGVAHFDGFVLTRVSRVSSHDRLQPVQPASASARDLRFVLMNILTLGIVCGLICLLWPLRHYAYPVVAHPAFWLGLIGLFGFFVAPAPVSASVILVAVSMPAFPRPKWWSKKSRPAV